MRIIYRAYILNIDVVMDTLNGRAESINNEDPESRTISKKDNKIKILKK